MEVYVSYIQYFGSCAFSITFLGYVSTFIKKKKIRNKNLID